MRQNHFIKLVRYMKNVYHVDRGLNKLSDGSSINLKIFEICNKSMKIDSEAKLLGMSGFEKSMFFLECRSVRGNRFTRSFTIGRSGLFCVLLDYFCYRGRI